MTLLCSSPCPGGIIDYRIRAKRSTPGWGRGWLHPLILPKFPISRLFQVLNLLRIHVHRDGESPQCLHGLLLLRLDLNGFAGIVQSFASPSLPTASHGQPSTASSQRARSSSVSGWRATYAYAPSLLRLKTVGAVSRQRSQSRHWSST